MFRSSSCLVLVAAHSFALFLPAAIGAQEIADTSWQTCMARLRSEALADGIGEPAVDSVLSDVKQLPRVIASDREQPEFTQTFADYYYRRVTDDRADKGRQLLQRHLQLLSSVQQVTGVPPQYLLSFWGLETNFGSFFGNLPLPSALATLACDTRRPAFFSRQLFATMRIVEAGDMNADKMIGSWAGALGHMQFMPTTFLDYAVDGDNDGRRDLLTSVADALWSGGNYLQSLGWEAGFRWGREVLLPEGFDYSLTGSDQWRPLSDWSRLAITDVFGRPLPVLDTSSAILLPSGHTGPAFLVYPNFNVIMGWNRSEYYALSVGRLADRIAGAGKLARPPSSDRLATRDIVQLQTELSALGFDLGNPDGVIGPATRKAVRQFQQQHQLIADGYPNPEVFAKAAQLRARQEG